MVKLIYLCYSIALPIIFIILLLIDRNVYSKWSIETKLKKKPKKREVTLRKDNYPFNEGESEKWDSNL